ncbi:hypothetical protein TRFO_02369 [Tritrichomonas foetus]|uniref:Peptidase S8/S53 domain-containing protein n=1 Tax=Tritrichomonas foetus TaxID=1144522 RepID=A0A1J4J8W6_9EUKA|nr:hypothetical protein TRFO_02369 [Tritrichomonas foetus]|eukprot:OHS93845.1 hypothetical protein TRFO_02369 [Tritrichomonas foetus]
MYLFWMLLTRFLLKNGVKLDSSLEGKISKHENAWYYVSSKNADIYSLENTMNSIKSEYDLILPIHNNLMSIFLSHDSAEQLNNNGYWVKKIPSKDKIVHVGKGNTYIALTSNNCSTPGKVLSKSHYTSIFQYDGNIEMIEKSKCIRSFSSFSQIPQFHTRFHRGMIFNNYNDFGFETELPFSSNSKLFSKSYRGSGQTIAIVDKGIDKDSLFFKTQKELPKIRKIFTFGDEKDSTDGHGTFIAGVAAGKNECSDKMSLYNGIASDAQLIIVDIHHKKNDNYSWPHDFQDLFEKPNQLGATVHLNTWTTDDPLISSLIDLYAYIYSNMTIIFSAENGINQYIAKPADSKNVLSVGETTGNPIIKYLNDTTGPIVVHAKTTGHYIYGYLDPIGVSLYSMEYLSTNNNDTNSVYQNFEFRDINNVLIGDKEGQIGTILSDDDDPLDYINSSAILVFTSDPIKTKMNIPIIHLPYDRRDLFFDGSTVSIYPSNHFSDSDTIPHMTIMNNSYKTETLFQIKPDIVAPGGPMLGPRSGNHKCNMSSLTIKHGASVSAALVAGSAAIIQQYYKKNYNISACSSLTRATIIHFSRDLIGVPTPSNRRGWGTPQVDDILDQFYYVDNNQIFRESKHVYTIDITSTGIIKATLVWNDYPRDPMSVVPLTQPLYLTMSKESTKNHHVFSNVEFESSTDCFNTVHSIEVPVSFNEKIMINVFSKRFELFNSVNYSLVISGQYSQITKTESSKGSQCPRNCEGERGSVCKNFQCECPTNRGGEFCNFKVEKATIGDPVLAERIEKKQWKFYKVYPEEWQNGSRLIINTEHMDKNNFKMFVNVGKPPSWNEHLCSRYNCPWGYVKTKTLSLKYDEWDFVTKENQFYFGIVCINEFPSDFEINFIHRTDKN